VDTEKELRDAMRELERKAQAIHGAFPTSDKAEREIKKQERELKDRLKQEYIDERLTAEKYDQLRNTLTLTVERAREAIAPERKFRRSNEMDF
jgi:hypothetical protein